MITGGDGGTVNSKNKVEIFHFNGTKLCDLDDLPSPKRLHTLDSLLLCYSTTCITFTDGSWITTHSFEPSRYRHMSWAFKDGVMLFGGELSNAMNTSTIISSNGIVKDGFGFATHNTNSRM